MKRKIAIIGGGAAGFFCAANLDETKFNVVIIEQNNDVLQKVKVSGGGRCNVTNACFEPKELVKFYPRGNKELLSIFYKFHPQNTINWFAERNVSLKVEKDNRVFPESNSSQTIIDILLKEVKSKNFEIKTKTVVLDIKEIENQYKIITKEEEILADYIVYATGSSPKSLKILENLGHNIVSQVPSLFTFNVKNDMLHDLMGTSFSEAEISIPQLKIQESGALLITHWGISGPAVLKLSSQKARELFDVKYNFEINVNFIGVNKKQAEEIFKNYRQQNSKKTIGNSKIFDITTRFWHRILWISKVDSSKNISNISKEELQKIVENLCQNKMHVKGKSTFKEEFVTAGGIELKEIDFKTMKSKILENLYIAGEVLNIDAVTGGFNFQACWSEAWLIATDLNSKN